METLHKIRVVSVNVSQKKGTTKTPVDVIEINENGIIGDAHAGPWHRQISLLGTESIAKGSVIARRKLSPGLFAENITTEGFPLYKMNCLDLLKSDTVTLQVTQIGKKCHSGCDIFKEIGDCVMPKEGIFARVLSCGTLKDGDELVYYPKVYRAMLITLSDRASKSIYPDKSGELLRQILSDFYRELNRQISFTSNLIHDDENLLKECILEASSEGYDFIFTTGGTGIGPRDITPDVVKRLLDKEIPGIMEFIRMKYGAQFPSALISRSIAGTIGNSLIFTLPGSPKAVKEYMDEIVKSLDHCVRMINSIDNH